MVLLRGILRGSVCFHISFLLLNTLGSHWLWAMQWDIPSMGILEIQLRTKAAKIIVKPSDNSQIKVTITGPKELEWVQEQINIESAANRKILKITGPEEGVSVADTTVILGLPRESISTKLVFEEVQADLQSVAQVQVTALKGQITSRSTGDGVHYVLQKGEIQSFQHRGALEIESFGGKVQVKEGQAHLKVQVFSGNILLEKNAGRLQLESQSSSAKIAEHQGVVSLQWGKGSLAISDFSGRIEGTSLEGQLQLQVKPESIIDLQAGRGRVSVALPPGSGASLNVKTVTGDLSVPQPLKPAREGKYRMARGKLAGAHKGSVTIRAEDASIVVK